LKYKAKEIFDASCDCPAGQCKTCVHVCCTLWSYLTYLSYFGVALDASLFNPDPKSTSSTSSLCNWNHTSDTKSGHFRSVLVLLRKPMGSIETSRVTKRKDVKERKSCIQNYSLQDKK